MPILHMETEQVYQMSRQLASMAEELGRQIRELENSLQLLESHWSGHSSQVFAREANYSLLKMRTAVQEVSELSSRIQREAEQWELVDTRGVQRLRGTIV